MTWTPTDPAAIPSPDTILAGLDRQQGEPDQGYITPDDVRQAWQAFLSRLAHVDGQVAALAGASAFVSPLVVVGQSGDLVAQNHVVAVGDFHAPNPSWGPLSQSVAVHGAYLDLVDTTLHGQPVTVRKACTVTAELVVHVADLAPVGSLVGASCSVYAGLRVGQHVQVSSEAGGTDMIFARPITVTATFDADPGDTITPELWVCKANDPTKVPDPPLTRFATGFCSLAVTAVPR